MNILLCLDNSANTEKLLQRVRQFAGALKHANIKMVHIIDEQLFYTTTGFEVQLNETLQEESSGLKERCLELLGEVAYMEVYGVPLLKIDEVLAGTDHDLVISGTLNSHSFGGRLMGSFAEHLLHTSTKPVLIIP